MTISFDAVSHGSTSATALYASTTHTTGAGANLLLIFVLWVDNSVSAAPYATDVIYNGVSLTYVARERREYTTNAYTVAEVWAMNNPPAGAYTAEAIVSETTAHGLALVCVSYGGTGGVGVSGGSSAGGGFDPSVTVSTSAATSLLVAGLAIRGGDITGVTPAGGVTQLVDSNSGSLSGSDVTYWVASTPGTGGADTVSGTQDANADHWSIIAVEVLAAGAGVTVEPSAATAASATAVPTIVLGSTTAAPTASTAASATAGPTVVLGSITLAPDATTAASGTNGPTVANDVAVEPTAATAASDTAGPDIVLGSTTATPTAATAASGTDGPTIVINSTIVTPTAATAASGTAGPTVVYGSVIVAPSAASGISGTALTGAFVIAAVTLLRLPYRPTTLTLRSR